MVSAYQLFRQLEYQEQEDKEVLIFQEIHHRQFKPEETMNPAKPTFIAKLNPCRSVLRAEGREATFGSQEPHGGASSVRGTFGWDTQAQSSMQNSSRTQGHCSAAGRINQSRIMQWGFWAHGQPPCAPNTRLRHAQDEVNIRLCSFCD